MKTKCFVVFSKCLVVSTKCRIVFIRHHFRSNGRGEAAFRIQVMSKVELKMVACHEIASAGVLYIRIFYPEKYCKLYTSPRNPLTVNFSAVYG